MLALAGGCNYTFSQAKFTMSKAKFTKNKSKCAETKIKCSETKIKCTKCKFKCTILSKRNYHLVFYLVGDPVARIPAMAPQQLCCTSANPASPLLIPPIAKLPPFALGSLTSCGLGGSRTLIPAHFANFFVLTMRRATIATRSLSSSEFWLLHALVETGKLSRKAITSISTQLAPGYVATLPAAILCKHQRVGETGAEDDCRGSFLSPVQAVD
ncbi:unnamed protein product [Phytophthora fragariaefolia]|uniref:Unnamed protein product n=1 Tax=Phytophthora fragariaefolia TaxID=1490495 RepID=A0A9W6X9Y1_9STRA|nr:unnamed protein product [Phytophthora fragariaefolia]